MSSDYESPSLYILDGSLQIRVFPSANNQTTVFNLINSVDCLPPQESQGWLD